MQNIESYRNYLLEQIQEYTWVKEPKNLYDPIDYILKLGGKRLRPILALMTCDIFGGNPKNAVNAALCVEVFHNFTLIHDDIMDDAPLRRGKKTVHEKWDLNTGILSGDAMLIMAYQLLEVYQGNQFQDLVSLFSKTAIEVCEGQQYDIDFESRNDVTVPEYLKMIEYKTAVLVGAAMQMGAIVAGANKEDQNAIFDFGRYLGIAFQLQDDYLDAFGDPATFGKQVGGDIIENKKTYLYLKAIEFADEKDKKSILDWFESHPADTVEKIEAVKQLFAVTGAKKATQDAVEAYTNKAFTILNQLQLPEDEKAQLKHFGMGLMTRNV
ncbi:polyprenyl synthetase family protein [Winogradskyella aurantia]|uniref:Polyprenyl synthetase n=1 Tax=Winogradskyella aurantia TaxID=1915063 RepID=A0A265V0P4_9FLAO|nr:polyprenyl synthetase family protein [Winogradskyella aurantia]OZV71062.1 polyprenyl synthetase [Winogradskyella aurantia]